MRFLTPFFLFFFSSFIAISQQQHNGYFISTEGKQISSLINADDETAFYYNPYYVDSSLSRKFLNPNEIKYFKIYNDEYFSFTIESGNSVFLKRIIRDSVSLFIHIFKPKTNFSDQDIDSSFYLKKTNTPLVKIKKESFRNDMTYYFSDCYELKQKITEKIYKYGDIRKIVTEYCDFLRERRGTKKFFESSGYSKNLYNHTLDFGIAAAIAASDDFRHSYTGGFRMEFGYNFPLFRNGLLLVKPRISYEFFQKDYTPANATEKLQKLMGGFIVKWNFYKPTFEEFNVYLILGADYIHLNNWLKLETGYDKDVLFGEWFQINPGLGASFKDFYIETEYGFFSPKVNFYPEFKSEMISNGYIFTEEHPQLHLNTFTITIGVHFNFKDEND